MKISIIVAVRNAENTIKRCIDSILRQNNNDLELIVIDGESTDNTLNILKCYAKDIDILVSEKDRGVYDAMNKGIKNASGDVLAFLNSDDWYCKDVLKRVEEIFESDSQIEMVYGDVLLENILVTSKRVAYDDFLDTLLNFNICHQCIFVKREVFNKIGVFEIEYKLAAEYDWMLRLVLSNIKTFHDNKFYVHYSTGGLSEKHVKEHSIEAWNSSKYWIKDANVLKIAEKRYKKNMAKVFWQKILNDLEGDELNVVRKELVNKGINSEIVIYGAGRFGRELKIILDAISIKVCAFIDRNCSEIGIVDGIPAISFEDYVNNFKGEKIIISPINGYEEIEGLFVSEDMVKGEDYLVLMEFLMELATNYII